MSRKNIRILNKVKEGKMTSKEAYELIYNPDPIKARFIKMKIKIKEHPHISRLINILFWCPIPMIFVKWIFVLGAKNINKEDEDYISDLQVKQIVDDFCRCGGLSHIFVEADEAKIIIETF